MFIIHKPAQFVPKSRSLVVNTELYSITQNNISFDISLENISHLAHTFCVCFIILTVTGESTLCTLLSSTRISLALAHKDFTSLSFITSQRRNCSICLKKLLIKWINKPNHVKKNKTKPETELNAGILTKRSRNTQRLKTMLFSCPLPSTSISLAKDKWIVCFCIVNSYEKRISLKIHILSCFVWLKSVLFNLLCVFGSYQVNPKAVVKEINTHNFFVLFVCWIKMYFP